MAGRRDSDMDEFWSSLSPKIKVRVQTYVRVDANLILVMICLNHSLDVKLAIADERCACGLCS